MLNVITGKNVHSTRINSFYLVELPAQSYLISMGRDKGYKKKERKNAEGVNNSIEIQDLRSK